MYRTIIASNGGGLAEDIEKLFERLATTPLNPTFESYGDFAHEADPVQGLPGAMFFFGNFWGLSAVFRILSDDPALIARLTAAIRANKATPAYRAARELVRAERKRRAEERAAAHRAYLAGK
jgi:hypothetical protein